MRGGSVGRNSARSKAATGVVEPPGPGCCCSVERNQHTLELSRVADGLLGRRARAVLSWSAGPRCRPRRPPRGAASAPCCRGLWVHAAGLVGLLGAPHPRRAVVACGSTLPASSASSGRRVRAVLSWPVGPRCRPRRPPRGAAPAPCCRGLWVHAAGLVGLLGAPSPRRAVVACGSTLPASSASSGRRARAVLSWPVSDNCTWKKLSHLLGMEALVRTLFTFNADPEKLRT
ncbi:DNA-directed RNA polymerase II subunit rpb1 [Frankliniella fusca]|uniref:DNA-directed RNA polymerase II subunit rpb1 n=1 Tax=Frankliniella fusca TaxID=407009 RepID=A0AAE1GZ41_9NEOP|nr:DNA-directed RNA polymerase II subunit rpb1 [Frankliniella fusca]